MNDANKKGRQLEDAVRLLEQIIVQSSPSLQHATLRLRGDVIVNDAGVHHEIDVWVDIDHGHGYDASYVFECKNWRKKVGKNEILIFSEKIRVARAQKGFFVAKSFTRDARAQAKKDPRIELSVVTEEWTDPLPHIPHFVVRTPQHSKVLFARNLLPGENAPVALEQEARCTLNGDDLSVAEASRKIVEQAIDEFASRLESEKLPAGDHDFPIERSVSFEPDQLIIGGRDVRLVEVSTKYAIRVAHPAIMSRYDIEKRGRIVYLAPVDMPGGQISLALVMAPMLGRSTRGDPFNV